MKIKGIEVPEDLMYAVKEINKLYFEANKEHIKEAQKRYREKTKSIPKSEEQLQKIRDYANNYYQTKLKDKLKQKRDLKKSLATQESPTQESPTLKVVYF